MTPSFVILDGNGVIIAVSDSWQEFGERTGLRFSNGGVGLNYLEHCEAEPGLQSRLRQLLAGQTQSITYVYRCPTPPGAGWFVVIGIPQSRDGSGDQGCVTIFHIDVSELFAEHMGAAVQKSLSAFDQAAEVDPGDLLVGILSEAIAHAFGVPAAESSPWTQLSPRELEVAQLIAESCSNREIANALSCSVHTIKRHVTSIMKKLRVIERGEIANWWHARDRR